MTHTVKADKSRLTLKGVEDGRFYLVHHEGARWIVEPAPERNLRARALPADKPDLGEPFAALADAGFTFEPLPASPVPPCRF